MKLAQRRPLRLFLPRSFRPPTEQNLQSPFEFLKPARDVDLLDIRFRIQCGEREILLRGQRLQNLTISLRHCDFSDAGQITSTLRMSASLARNSAVPTPWIVFPSPMSSARMARPAPAANAIPSS
jgi:hypothetical protein